MRQTIYITTFIFFLTAYCQNGSATNELRSEILEIDIPADTLKTDQHVVARRKVVNDSLTFQYDSLFSDMNLVQIEISQVQFQLYKSKYKISCEIDSGKFIKGSGIYVRQLCDEVCETYLYEYSTNRRMLIPSDYDGGILSMLFSPSCSQLMVYSSYDFAGAK